MDIYRAVTRHIKDFLRKNLSKSRNHRNIRIVFLKLQNGLFRTNLLRLENLDTYFKRIFLNGSH